MTKPLKYFPLLISALLISGCGRRDKAGAPPPPADTPDQAILNVAKSIENNDPSGAWHMLPESFQADLNGVVRNFASAMDEEIWSAGTGTLSKLEEVLRKQKRFFLASDMAAMMGGREAIEKDYDQAVKLFSILKQSDLMDLNKLRNADLGRILSTTGADLMKAADEMQGSGPNLPNLPGFGDPGEIKEVFANMEAELVSQDGDQAVVRISTPDEEPEDVDFVRVEGKWIPKDLADDWTEMIQEMRAGVANMGTIDPQQKSQVMMMTSMANGILDQLLNARNQEEFNAVLGGLMGMMMGGM
ncbi:MAG: hypothetical protein JJU05_12905 [Verrucomicrobia bacterium]|nr:hypothetical protein [Verrucomicrobiota bacterium]MCH8528467.1 hypothetical protein [Kiritimatiellia bacterium]